MSNWGLRLECQSEVKLVRTWLCVLSTSTSLCSLEPY